MRRTPAFYLIAALLSACSPSTPLSEAVTALREGDVGAFARAKGKAEQALQSIKSPTCGFDLGQIRERAELQLIARLDRKIVFDSGEDERLVYALNVVGQGIILEDEAFAQRLLDYDGPRCPPLDSAQRAASEADNRADENADSALRAVLKN